MDSSVKITGQDFLEGQAVEQQEQQQLSGETGIKIFIDRRTTGQRLQPAVAQAIMRTSQELVRKVQMVGPEMQTILNGLHIQALPVAVADGMEAKRFLVTTLGLVVHQVVQDMSTRHAQNLAILLRKLLQLQMLSLVKPDMLLIHGVMFLLNIACKERDMHKATCVLTAALQESSVLTVQLVLVMSARTAVAGSSPVMQELVADSAVATLITTSIMLTGADLVQAVTHSSATFKPSLK
jgi:hypothetical protein